MNSGSKPHVLKGGPLIRNKKNLSLKVTCTLLKVSPETRLSHQGGTSAFLPLQPLYAVPLPGMPFPV